MFAISFLLPPWRTAIAHLLDAQGFRPSNVNVISGRVRSRGPDDGVLMG
jgi:hypothetical protein